MEKKEDYDKQVRKIKKPKIKAPANLEAVYENGVFIGRKVRDPLIPESVHSPEDYKEYIKDVSQPLKNRLTLIMMFIELFEDRKTEILDIPKKTLIEIIDQLRPDDLSQLQQRFGKIKVQKIIPYMKHVHSILKKNPKHQDWMIKESEKLILEVKKNKR